MQKAGVHRPAPKGHVVRRHTFKTPGIKRHACGRRAFNGTAPKDHVVKRHTLKRPGLKWCAQDSV